MYSRKSVRRFSCVHMCYKVHIFLFCFLKRFWTLSFIFDITSYNFLQVFVLLNARKRLFWNVSCNFNFIWRTLQCLFLILGIIGSFLFYGFRQGIFIIFIFFLVSLFDQYCLPYLFSLLRCSPHSLFYDFFEYLQETLEYPWHVMGYWPPPSKSTPLPRSVPPLVLKFLTLPPPPPSSQTFYSPSNWRFPVQVWLLVMCRGELSAVITWLISKCLWSRW